MKDFGSFIPAVCAAGEQTLGHHACGMVRNMNRFFTEIGEFLLAALMIGAGTYLLMEAMSDMGGINLMVKAFESAICGG